jgi:hypothetical protein
MRHIQNDCHYTCKVYKQAPCTLFAHNGEVTDPLEADDFSFQHLAFTGSHVLARIIASCMFNLQVTFCCDDPD